MTAQAPPGTLVPADDNLFPPLAHGGIWLVLGVLAAAAAVALLWWAVRTAPAIGAKPPAELTVQQRYVAEIDELARQFARGEIDARELHHRLSGTVRRIAADHGAPGALAMTPVLLDEVGHRSLASVVAGYQPPQFMEQPDSDPDRSLACARALIDDIAGVDRGAREAP